MSATSTSAGGPKGSPAAFTGSTNVWQLILKYIALFIGDGLGLLIFYALLKDDNLLLALVFGFITVMLNVVILVPRLYPLKWMSPGLALVTLLVIYPIIYTVITAFTNYSDGHLLTKGQAIDLIEKRKYLPEDALIYDWTLFANEEGEYALWLTRELEDSSFEILFGIPGEPLEEVDADSPEPPETYDDYRQLERAERAKALAQIQDLQFGTEEDGAGIKNRREAARPYEQRYVYDPETDSFFDQKEEVVYHSNDELGCFVPENVHSCGLDSGAIVPGYRTIVGLDNFERLITDPGFRGPLIEIFLWTLAFAFLSVATTFAMGLFMALVLNDPIVPGRKILRSLLIIPYAIPGVIGILIWRGMLNQNLGIISVTLQSIGLDIRWFADPWAAKFAIIMVNLWLGYPYMMLICSGALQSIPGAIYEAAAVDGANEWHRFWRITLPLLLVTVGPLLIASFTYNFNNYLMIEALTEGNPAMPDTPTPAGYSDILISYTYELAFGSDRGADYGYASAITLLIFFVTALITLFQYRFTKTWEEVGENV